MPNTVEQIPSAAVESRAAKAPPSGRSSRLLAAVFAGDGRVWRVAAIAALPALLLLVFYCLKPRPYYTGTNNVEVYTYVAPTPARAQLCIPGLSIPAGTARIRLQLASLTQERPRMRMLLSLGGRDVHSELPPTPVPISRISTADFPIPRTSRPQTSASACVTADGLVNWGGTPLPTAGTKSPTIHGAAIAARVALWYLPRARDRSSYLQRAGDIFKRAALFRPGIVGAWTYPVLLLLVLPAIIFAALRTLALGVTGRTRRLAAWVFAIAALNGFCWALVTPAFQAPDEVDHFAYVQSVVERGKSPSNDFTSSLPRWSSSESLALEDMSFFTDHQVGDTRIPWLASQQRAYRADAERLHPPSNNGGGYTTSATHRPLYYLALAPAYLVTKHSSVFSQLTLLRMFSALLGALVSLFTYLLVRELAPRRPWLAVLAALLVSFEPMYGFISGIVNNDVGVNACAAAVEFLVIRILRRGITIPLGLLTGVALAALPLFKGTGLSLYPVAGLALLMSLWRRHGRRDLAGWAALAIGGLVAGEILVQALNTLQPAASTSGASGVTANAGAVNGALHNLTGFLSYVWQVFLPRLSFMTPHFPSSIYPAFVIFIERGWGAFGWYDVFFPGWVYWVVFVVILLTFLLAALASRLEWTWVKGHWPEIVALVAMPVAVIVGVEAAYYTPGIRGTPAEFGRYAFPAIGALAVLTVGALHAFGRRFMLSAGVVLVVAIASLSYASQLLTLTAFYA
jgi:hypothetical protein